jgi:hypothetical protein
MARRLCCAGYNNATQMQLEAMHNTKKLIETAQLVLTTAINVVYAWSLVPHKSSLPYIQTTLLPDLWSKVSGSWRRVMGFHDIGLRQKSCAKLE